MLGRGIFMRRFLSFSFMFVFTALVLVPVFSAGHTVSTVSVRERALPVIVVDAGHGGMDGGAVGPDGLLEKDLNLSISLRLADFLRAFGFPVVLTRDADEMQGGKAEDIRARAALAESCGEDAIFVSIHQNKFPQTSSHGTQTFFGLRGSGSEALAELLQTEIVRKLQPENHRMCQQGGSGIYLLKNLPCTAVMIECGFLSNDDDVRLLTDETYQARLAFVIAGTILEYVNQTEV